MKNNLIYGKVPPQAKELESAVLGAIMLEKEAYGQVADVLKPESFYVLANETIYRAIVNLARKNQPVDILTIMQELIGLGKLESVGGANYLTQLTKDVVSSAHIKAHADIINRMYVSRELLKVAGNIINRAYDGEPDVFELISEVERSLIEISDKSSNNDMVHISQVVHEAHDRIEDWSFQHKENPDIPTGVPTGFTDLDRATRGWQPGDLILLAARPSVGKTALMLALIRHAALGIKPTVVAAWSLEMKAIYLVLRMLSAESNTVLYKIQTGRLDDNEMAKLVKEGMKVLSTAGIYFDDKSEVSLRTITAKSRRLKKKEGLGLIVIDYLQLMESEGKKENRNLEIGTISRDLKKLAVELQVPIIALSQLSREAEKHITWESGPPAWTLRDSGSLEQDADLIIMLWGPSDKDIEKAPEIRNKRRARIVKQRNGVRLTVELDFQDSIQLFKNGEDSPVTNVSNWKPIRDAANF
ncbi:MAG: replicative DNA helicase [Chitinophagaceae bacterium]|nr:replicative DNA helicase [Chitinophagaceae bacterium]